MPAPPWHSPPLGGRSSITFDYTVIDLSSMTAEELRQTGLPGILPLMILTRDWATREVAEEIMSELEPLGDEEVSFFRAGRSFRHSFIMHQAFQLALPARDVVS